MTRPRAAALVGVLLLPGTVQAQSHPCDVAPATVYREPRGQLASLRLGWCMVPVDTEGTPITEPLGFSLQVNGGPAIDLGLVRPLVGANAQGAAYYEVTTPALGPGVVTLRAYTATLGMSAASEPITLTLLGSPTQPIYAVIQR